MTTETMLMAVSATLAGFAGAVMRELVNRLNRVEGREEKRLDALIEGSAAVKASVAATLEMTELLKSQGAAIAQLAAEVRQLMAEARAAHGAPALPTGEGRR